jgi:hypothetical protein
LSSSGDVCLIERGNVEEEEEEEEEEGSALQCMVGMFSCRDVSWSWSRGVD